MKITLILSLALSALNLAHADSIPSAQVGKITDPASSSSTAITYTFSKDSKIEFTGSKVVGSHDGGFKSFTGEFKVENGTPTSGSFTITMDSLWSDSKKLTAHLKNEDFFHVEKHKESTFQVTSFQKKSDSLYSVSGNLTMVGKTQNITFPASVKQEEDAVSLSSEFYINRQEWGINYPGMPDNLIKDKVLLKLALVAQKN